MNILPSSAPSAGQLDLLPELATRPVGRAPTLLRQLFGRVSAWNRRRLVRRRANRPIQVVKNETPISAQEKALREYQLWTRQFDTLTPTLVESFRLRCQALEFQPLISVIMPVFNPDLTYLVEAVQSVKAQIYPHWELCIADDVSTDPEVVPWLTKLAASDTRVKFVKRERNGHISEASNSALALGRGEFVALLDQDDLLRPHSLLLVAEALNRCRDAAVLYSDEDKIDDDGQRSDPYFKCDWNPYLFRSHNSICHLGVYRRSLVEDVGGFRCGFEGAQDYDLALRCIERVAPRQVVHLPFVLYHWRVHDKSTAKGIGVKPYARKAGELALQEHLDRCGIAGKVSSTACGYRVRYALPERQPSVCIIVPTRNRGELLRMCITSVLEETLYENFEIIVVDNGSDDDDVLYYLREIAEHPKVSVLRDDLPFNFSRLNNLAARHTQAEYLCLLNNDTEVLTPGWLGEMVSVAAQPGVGAVGAKLLYPDGRVQHAGVVMGIGGIAGHAHKFLGATEFGYFGRARLLQEFSAVTGACLLVKRSAYLDVGGLDEKHLAVAFNDVDLCLKLQERKLSVVWTPYAVLYHHESVSRGQEDSPKKQARFCGEVYYMRHRWEDVIRNDPRYSPNLTLQDEQFSFATPPRVMVEDAYWYRCLPETA